MSDLPRGKGDPDFYKEPGEAEYRKTVEHIEDPIADWTSEYRELGDYMADGSDDQEYEQTDIT